MEETRDYAFTLYASAYPHMSEKHFKTFNEFWNEIKPKKVELDQRSKEEIMQEMLGIEKSFMKGGN